MTNDMDYIHERNCILIKLCWICLLAAVIVSLPNAPERLYMNELIKAFMIGAMLFGCLTYMIRKRIHIMISMYGIILCNAAVFFFLTYMNPVNMNYILFFSLLGVSMYYNSYKPLLLTSLILIFVTNFFFLMDDAAIFIVLPPYDTDSSLVIYNLVIFIICIVFGGQMYISKKMYRRLQLANEILEQAKEELSTDALTGIYNYKYFKYFVTEKLKRKEAFGFIMIDMDKFKEINDEFGHMAGNMVLQELARFLRRVVGEDDMLFRFGGDEFCIILQEAEKCREQVEKILKEKDKVYSFYEGNKIVVNFSAGIYQYDGKEVITLRELVEKADKGMYEAKKQGGNRIFEYDS